MPTIDIVNGVSYNENIRMHPGSNDYSSLILGAVAGTSGTGSGQWSLVRYPASNGNKFTLRHNSSDYIEVLTSGATTISTDTRSPIFYDSDYTSYYVNPNGLSRIRGLQITGNADSRSTLDQIGFWDTTNGVPGTTSAIGFKQVGGIWAEHGGTNAGYNTYFSMDTLNRGWVFRRVTAGGSDYTGVNVASIRNDGTAYFNGDVTANYSDIRLKTVLGKIENPIEKVKSLNGFYYEPNDIAETYGYEKERRVGVSAQDVEAVLPEIVKDAPIGDGYKTVDYAKLVPLLIESIKELSNKVEELENKLNGTN